MLRFVWRFLGERDECSLEVAGGGEGFGQWRSGYCKSPVLSEAGANLGTSELCGISHYPPQQQLPDSQV